MSTRFFRGLKRRYSLQKEIMNKFNFFYQKRWYHGRIEFFFKLIRIFLTIKKLAQFFVFHEKLGLKLNSPNPKTS